MQEELKQIGSMMMDYVDRLGERDAFIPPQPFENSLPVDSSTANALPGQQPHQQQQHEEGMGGVGSVHVGVQGEDRPTIPADETQDAFQIMGFVLPTGIPKFLTYICALDSRLVTIPSKSAS